MKYILDYNYFLNESRDLLQDGITQDEVIITQKHIIDNLLPLLRLKEEDISFIGSAGKLKDSNDISYNINMVINIDKLNKSNKTINSPVDFIILQIDRLGYKTEKQNDGNLIINWPINGLENNKQTIELIIEITGDFEWVKFARYSPSLNNGESNFSGKYRRALLSSIIESIDKKVISYSDNKDNVEEYSKLIFDIHNGIYRIYKKLIHTNLNSGYSSVIEDKRKLITNNPKDLIDLLFFDTSISIEELMTFEGIKSLILDKSKFKFFNKLNQIKSRFQKKCFELKIELIEL